MNRKIKRDIIDQILEYGQMYKRTFLSKLNTKELLSNWWKALEFFLFGKAFFQGRSDERSAEISKLAFNVLEPIFSRDDGIKKIAELDNNLLNDIEIKLKEKIGKGKKGKSGDIKMTLSTLKYVNSLHGHNLVRHSYEMIKSREVKKHYVY